MLPCAEIHCLTKNLYCMAGSNVKYKLKYGIYCICGYYGSNTKEIRLFPKLSHNTIFPGACDSVVIKAPRY